MKIVKTISKILVALAAIAGAVYVIATYGDKIVAWAKGLLERCKCCGDCGCECGGECKCNGECDCDCDGECECECQCCEAEETPVEEVPVEEAPAEETPVEEAPVAEEGAVVAEETDFEA